jgi:hypothetical protein
MSSSCLSTNPTTRHIEEMNLPSPNLQQTRTVSRQVCGQALRDKHRGAPDVEMNTRRLSQILIESRLSIYKLLLRQLSVTVTCCSTHYITPRERATDGVGKFRSLAVHPFPALDASEQLAVQWKKLTLTGSSAIPFRIYSIPVVFSFSSTS